MNRLPIAFRRLALSNLAAQSAEQIGLAVAPLVAVLSLGASASGTGLLQTAQTLPFLLLSIPLGVWADRHSRKRIMAAAEGLRALALAATLALLAAHALTLPSLAMLGFVGACGTVAYSVAAPALIPALVGRAALARANGAIELARSAAYSAGPAIGAALVDRIGAQWAYGFAAALSAHAVLLIVRLPDVRAPAAPRKRFVAELLDGARFVRRDRHLRPMIVTAVFFNVGFFTLQAVYVPYAVRHLALGASQIGMTFAAYGIGMTGGAVLASAIARRVRFGVVLTIGPVGGLVASLVMAVSIFAPSFWLAASSFFLLGAGPILWSVASTTLRQAITPPAMLGRVCAINGTATYGARPLGALVGAVVAARFGIDACIWASVGGFVIQAAVIVRSAVSRLERIPDVSDAAPRYAPLPD
ncbi:MFS transporter [Burkholderia pseudomallei]|uniref:MFS transporter n=1 Tax=Burkholderia pseudomallei TaxID=28450 RepID=UPI0003D8B104|nr:MFS transporter [Burkholderia pseudomallei]AHE31257.1 major Facilitator Superfamily protein [Burkholderia pseudomallei NCTC 13178]KAA8765479.1 MFS transporter [Burkholderia pseudomallei]KGV65483.1 major Facilitator Superfamily protein [Burkholderia pseudomallei MSHR3964]KGV83334.1 major Facilitator Superfamily protein [Burkholderia pseudomallei MSHR3951]KGV84681.1 major Facilitator Superfamily protein [Burkholderia pseudomallei MSHR3960]